MRTWASNAESLESHLEHLKKTVSDSGFRLAMRRDLAGAKHVQQAFFPPESLSIPCMTCQTFYQPAHEIGGDYYDFFSLAISVTLGFARHLASSMGVAHRVSQADFSVLVRQPSSRFVSGQLPCCDHSRRSVGAVAMLGKLSQGDPVNSRAFIGQPIRNCGIALK